MKEEDREKIGLTEGRAMDYTIVYLIAKRLTKSIENLEAYKLGIIDDEGKKIREPKTSEEKDAYTILDRMILRLRHLIGNHKIASLTAAFLLSEETDATRTESEEELIEHHRKKIQAEKLWEQFQELLEESGLEEEQFWTHLLQNKV